MRLCWVWLLSPGCFVITSSDVDEHDQFTGQWEGTFESSEIEGELSLSLGKEEWEGEIGIEDRFEPCGVQGTRSGEQLDMELVGLLPLGEGLPFRAELQAKLTRVDQVEGSCVVEVEGLDEDDDCTFSLSRR